jgi:hypothetical protein
VGFAMMALPCVDVMSLLTATPAPTLRPSSEPLAPRARGALAPFGVACARRVTTWRQRPGDKLHPNRTGYLSMGMAIDLDLFKPKQQSR